MAAGGLAAASLTGGGSGSSARQADVKNVAVGGTGAGADNAAAAMPSGNQAATVTLDGRSWAVWKDGSYWMPGNSTLGQVDYGVELVSTNGVPATFSSTDFSVSAS